MSQDQKELYSEYELLDALQAEKQMVQNKLLPLVKNLDYYELLDKLDYKESPLEAQRRAEKEQQEKLSAEGTMWLFFLTVPVPVTIWHFCVRSENTFFFCFAIWTLMSFFCVLEFARAMDEETFGASALFRKLTPLGAVTTFLLCSWVFPTQPSTIEEKYLLMEDGAAPSFNGNQVAQAEEKLRKPGKWSQRLRSLVGLTPEPEQQKEPLMSGVPEEPSEEKSVEEVKETSIEKEERDRMSSEEEKRLTKLGKELLRKGAHKLVDKLLPPKPEETPEGTADDPPPL
jgi:putative solute:sodium symporter small subunit